MLTAWKEFEPYEVVATTYQAISGAGKTFKEWPEMEGNIIPVSYTHLKEIYQKAGIAEYWIISPKERAVEVYYLENGEYDLKYSYVLQDDPEEKHYNADTVVTLREFPNISMTLADMFENIE